ncbi:hypothetical protein ABW20_dc0108500 [Dactylellina cionopaga]|nr:hypothetical protein ABW20_dc0108500 [Dactylellina cionopaga]
MFKWINSFLAQQPNHETPTPKPGSTPSLQDNKTAPTASFSTLPLELQIEIFSYITAAEQITLVKVCPSWETILLKTESLKRIRYPQTPARSHHFLLNRFARLGFWARNGVIENYRFVHEGEERHGKECERRWKPDYSRPWPRRRSPRPKAYINDLPDEHKYDGWLLEDISSCKFLDENIFAASVDDNTSGVEDQDQEGAGGEQGEGGEGGEDEEDQPTHPIEEIRIESLYFYTDQGQLNLLANYKESITLLRDTTTVKQYLDELARVLDPKVANFEIDVSKLHEVEIHQKYDDDDDDICWQAVVFVHYGVPTKMARWLKQHWWDIEGLPYGSDS